MRLFIAVPLPADLRERAAALLSPALPALKRVTPERMHVTLAFLGWTPDDRLPEVVAAAESAARGREPFRLTFDHAGRFPPTGRPRVAWLGVGDGAEPLAALAAAVGEELRDRQLRFDDRAFAPHLTLARVREEASLAEARTLGAAVEALAVPALESQVDRIAVIRSDLSPKGPRYTDLAVAALG